MDNPDWVWEFPESKVIKKKIAVHSCTASVNENMQSWLVYQALQIKDEYCPSSPPLCHIDFPYSDLENTKKIKISNAQLHDLTRESVD